MLRNIDADLKVETWSKGDSQAHIPVSLYEGYPVVIVSVELLHQMLTDLGWSLTDTIEPVRIASSD